MAPWILALQLVLLSSSPSSPPEPLTLEEVLAQADAQHPTIVAASADVEAARADVARLVGAEAREIAWTSGATESNNLAIKGAAMAAQSRGKHLVTVQTEHKAVLDTMKWLEKQGFSVTCLAPQKNGLLDLDTFRAALRPDTVLASVMLVNNEIGVIQDIAAIECAGLIN
jgi:cysteine desulfurase